jgi:hypothetical protein
MSAANADALGRPRRSVPALGIMNAKIVRFGPRVIAGILACTGGLLWAALLAPFTLFLFSGEFSKIGAAYIICGYLVFFGWLWRVSRTPSSLLGVVLWLTSFVVNTFPLVFWKFMPRPSDHWDDLIAELWWLFASLVSLVALFLERTSRKDKADA